MDLHIYKQQAKQIKEFANEVLRIAKKEEAITESKLIGELIDRLNKDDFKVLVVGEFSRGKSTFINALLGSALLPASTNPTTAIITKILYGEEPHVDIYGKKNKGKYKRITLDEFSKLRVPKNYQEDAKPILDYLNSISWVELKYPLELCKNNVQLIDSPGVNDTETDRIEITNSYLKHADAAIILLAANQALTNTELKFIKNKLRDENIMDIFLVINFKDTINGEDAEQRVIKYVSENLEEHIPDLDLSKNIFLVSSKEALTFKRHQAGESISQKTLDRYLPDNLESTGFLELENRITYFLANEKGRARVKRNLYTINKRIKGVFEVIEKKKVILQTNYDQLLNKIGALEPRLYRSEKDIEKIIEEYKRKTVQEKSKIDDIVNDHRAHMLHNVDEYFDSCSIDEEELKKNLEALLGEDVENIKLEVEAFQKEYIGMLRTQYYQKLLRSWKTINRDCNEALDIETTMGDKKLDLTIDASKAAVSKIGGTGVTFDKFCEIVDDLVEDNIFLNIIALPIVGITGLVSAIFGLGRENRIKLKNSTCNMVREFYQKVEESLQKSYESNIENDIAAMRMNFKDKIEEIQHQIAQGVKQKKASKAEVDRCVLELIKEEQVLIKIQEKIQLMQRGL